MIQIESVRIHELRGIRDLEIGLGRKSFVVSGPNGSGKSGVVDAIQFGLTGEISRLEGKGTGGLSVQRHGPHVDRRDDPAAAEVSITLYVPETGKTGLLTRNVKTAKSFTLDPDDPEIRAAVEEAAQHPELSLSRREIIKYIIVEAGQRSKEIQALLKLEEIGSIRSVLKTTSNKISASYTAAKRVLDTANDSLRRHLDVTTLSPEQVLASVNPHRKILALAEVKELEEDTRLNAGVSEGGPEQPFNKQSALRDIAALQEARSTFPTLGSKEAGAVLKDLEALEANPSVLDSIKRRSFVERGLAFVDGTCCPLCDKDWEDEEHLKAHLKAKLHESEEAEKLQSRLLENGAEVAIQGRKLATLVDAVVPLAKKEGPEGLASEVSAWSGHLTALAEGLVSVEKMVTQKEQLQAGWIAAPPELKGGLEKMTEAIKATPDQSATVAAQTFLTLAEDRLKACRLAKREERKAETGARAGNVVYRTYCDVSEKVLGALYAAVEDDFSEYYREINSDDESGFKAKLEPAEGGLDLEVDFYDRGMFPPGAYHSEGHQDGMGLCLYLALMKRQLVDRFRFAVFDDVVMSVDRNHRKQLCKLLKSRFPETQFIITTHDKVWAKQMQTEGLVTAKAGIAFHNWSLQTGPVFEAISEVWDQIENDIGKEDIEAAAGRLRRHLEYVGGELADQLGARPVYRGDFSYDMGDLLPAVIGRHGELVSMAAAAADSWNDNAARGKVEAVKSARAKALAKCGGEQWIINKAVHYNEWANFSKEEFRAVAQAFKEFLQQLRCTKPECESWLYVSPKKGVAQALRCHCTAVNLNLKTK